jgi:nicotinamide-nucleotide amidase
MATTELSPNLSTELRSFEPSGGSIPVLAQRAVDLAWSRDARIAVAESCTAGGIAAALAGAEGSGACFQGGVVAYSSAAKFSMLGVQPGPVICHEAARQMARGALDRFDADVAIATTGVIGPAREERQPVGTLWLGGCSRRQPALAMRKILLGEEPAARCEDGIRAGLRLLIMLLEQ